MASSAGHLGLSISFPIAWTCCNCPYATFGTLSGGYGPPAPLFSALNLLWDHLLRIFGGDKDELGELGELVLRLLPH